jgi:hypothetical protein
MAGFARDSRSDDIIGVEELNKNPFVTESSFPSNTDIEKVKKITTATMSKYKNYNVLVRELMRTMI